MRFFTSFLLLAMPLSAVEFEKIPYRGHDAYRLTNSDVELVVVTGTGPRILRYSFIGGPNVFVEFSEEDEARITGGAEWKLHGGHRIWVGPEAPSYTYAPDNEPTEVSVEGGKLRSTQPADIAGIEKEIEVELDAEGTSVRVTHRLRNRSMWPLEMAPWALSMMAPGGHGITTFPPRGTHPEDLPPSNPLMMWAFTNLSDPRWTFLEKYLVLRQDPQNPDPEKLGHFNEHTRGAYLLGDTLFVKRFEADPSKSYPDMGVSFETFTNAYFLELETLGPLQRVEPGATIEHVETWSLHRGVEVGEWTDAELDRKIAPLLR